MKALMLTERYGLEHLHIQEVPEPKIGARDVVIRAEAYSLNYLDLMVTGGVFRNPLPHTIGSDAAGTVMQVGPDVTTLRKGDRVVGHYTQDWQEGAIRKAYLQSRLGVETGGIFAEYVALPEHAWVKIPGNLSLQAASTLPIAALTAWEALVGFGRLLAGQTVMLQGSGGVSVFALQFAKALGAKVIISSSQDEKLATLRQLGADHGINYRTTDVAEEVRRITGGEGVDLALEVVGSALSETIKLTAFGGKVALIGFLGGPSSEVRVTEIITKNIEIKGIQVGSRQAFRKMNTFIEENNIQPLIDRTFPLAEYRDAMNRLRTGRHIGKIVLTRNQQKHF